MDVLVSTLQPPLVGALEDDNVLPAVGNDAYDMAQPGTLSTALELYRVAGGLHKQKDVCAVLSRCFLVPEG